MVKNASCQCQGERQADVRFPRKSILFPCYIKELSIHVHCVCPAESINKWVERMAVRGGWRPLSGLICEIVNSVGQGNFTFVREKSGNFKHLWLWQPCESQIRSRSSLPIKHDFKSYRPLPRLYSVNGEDRRGSNTP